MRGVSGPFEVSFSWSRISTATGTAAPTIGPVPEPVLLAISTGCSLEYKSNALCFNNLLSDFSGIPLGGVLDPSGPQYQKHVFRNTQYGFGYIIIRSPNTPYSIYLRRTNPQIRNSQYLSLTLQLLIPKAEDNLQTPNSKSLTP